MFIVSSGENNLGHILQSGQHIEAGTSRHLDVQEQQFRGQRFHHLYRLINVARLPNDYRQLSEAVTVGIPLTAASNNPLVGRYRDAATRLIAQAPARKPACLESSINTRTDVPVPVGAK